MHKISSFWAILTLPFAIAACSTSSTVTEPFTAPAAAVYTYSIDRRDMTIAGLEAMQAALEERLAAAGLLASDGRGLPLEIRVEEYHMRDPTARVMGGVFAGKDRIVSRVRVVLRDGSSGGEFTVQTGNITVMGSAGGLIDRHAQEIVSRLAGR